MAGSTGSDGASRDAPPARTTRRDFVRKLGSGLAAAGIASGGGLLAGGCAPAVATTRRPTTLASAEALLVVFSDTHSAYERYPQLLAAIDQVRAQHPRTPLLILFNGDLFERGNVVALRGGGRADLALLEALSQRAPVVFNLGNHEGALLDLAEAVQLLQERGATVVSNALDRRTGRPFVPPAASLEIAGRGMVVAGIATDDLATYRPGVRETLQIPPGPDYAAEQLARLLGDAPLRVVLSHAGTLDDQKMLPAVPAGTLVVGGHDHLRYAHRQGRTLYLHTGSWGESITLVGVRQGPSGTEWLHESLPIALDGPGATELATLIQAERQAHLTAEDRAIIGRTECALPLREAALLAVAAVRDAVGADVAFIGNTTFGAGLPAGAIPRYDFDAYLRFDGVLQRAEADGATLQAILRRANQFEEISFDVRTGEYLVATPLRSLDSTRRYTVATNDWVRLNAERYLGTALDFTPLPELTLKAVVARRLGG
ncbi:MAG: bifunctional metallophosphatase/5'-nucleotidase [Gemmatimonadetes bacterium]|nr:bifunctional metallophosphatase/5'-nucleotidase [Gemmatimonadota bacterium]